MRKIDYSDRGLLRDIIGEYIVKLGERDGRVMLLNADMMKAGRNKKFVEKFPDRSFNISIAEQNMVGFAAGLAHEGFKPYCFSMAPFLSMRACEQIRTDVAYDNLNVRLMSIYSGVSGGISGATHWGIEDCGIIRSIPNITIIEFSDVIQAEKLLEQTLNFQGAIYFRISCEAVARIYDEADNFVIGKAVKLQDGSDGTYICAGVTVQYALEAAERIKESTGARIGVIDMYTIKPLDRDAVIDAAKTGHVIVAQDHNTEGGLGDAVARVIAEEKLLTNYKCMGIPDKFEVMAHPQFLYSKFGIDAEGLQREMLHMLDKK